MERKFFEPYEWRTCGCALIRRTFRLYRKDVFGRHVRNRDEPPRVMIRFPEGRSGKMRGHIVPESVIVWQMKNRRMKTGSAPTSATKPATKPSLFANLSEIERANRMRVLAETRAA